MAAVRSCFEFACSFNDDPVVTHQPPNPTMTNIDPDLLQLLCHPGPAITTKTEARLFLDVGQNDHVRMLSATGRAAPKGPHPPRADVHNLTQPVCCEAAAMFLDEPKPSHGLQANPCRAVPSRLLAREELGGLLGDVPLLAKYAVLAPKPFVFKRKFAILMRHHIRVTPLMVCKANHCRATDAP